MQTMSPQLNIHRWRTINPLAFAIKAGTTIEYLLEIQALVVATIIDSLHTPSLYGGSPQHALWTKDVRMIIKPTLSLVFVF